jgi:hypothetical protein
MKDTTYRDNTQWLVEHYDSAQMKLNPSQMAADVARKYRQLESTRLAAMQEGDKAEYTKVRAQQDVLADLLDKWNVSVEDAGIDYTRLAPDMP